MTGVQMLSRDLLGVIVCQRNDENIWSDTRGYATLVVARELGKKKRWVWAESDTGMNTADMGTKYLSATTRTTLMALMPMCFGEMFGLVTMAFVSREAVKTSDVTTAMVYDDASHFSGDFPRQSSCT